MLQITIPDREFFDEAKQEFIVVKGATLMLEHSLISVSKWESKWKKPFLTAKGKNFDETVDYIRCMTLNKNVDPDVYLGVTRSIVRKVNEYIDDTMTATWFREDPNKKKANSQVITSELVYYWMISMNIPIECEKWHLNRLFTLIRICEIKNAPSKKMKKKDVYSQYRALNSARKNKLGTSG